jgi:predicted dehydrogenase
MTARVRVAVAGTGTWGVNHVRVLAAEPRCELVAICEPDPRAAERARHLAPGARAATWASLLDDPRVDAIVIATPAATHAELACEALAAGKHVLVEKPLALGEDDAARVAAAARAADRVLLVGHLMVYHPAVVRLRDMLGSGELGELYYLYSRRVNLGRLRHDESALWSFGPHDLSMFDFLLRGAEPVSVTARGQSYLQPGVEDVVFVSLRFAGGQMAHVHLSWLDPHKERRLTLVCSQKMVEFDDVAAEKLRVYDKGYERPPEFTHWGEYLTLRDGDVHMPHVAMEEPLALEARHFLDCCLGEAAPRTGADGAVRVVRTLAAAQRSLRRDGAPEVLSTSEAGSPAPLDRTPIPR